MNITLLCSDVAHPVMPWLQRWAKKMEKKHTVSILNSRNQLAGGDFLFLVSCSEMISSVYRSLYRHTLVLHASDLPHGRGWSPHVWELVGGANHLTLSLLEAEDKVDSGRIWLKKRIQVSPDALWYEVNELLFKAEIQLIEEAVENYEDIEPTVQPSSEGGSYYRRRTPEDSEIDASLSLSEQFDLIRMCDPDRYPATFRLRGKKYRLKLEKADDEDDSH